MKYLRLTAVVIVCFIFAFIIISTKPGFGQGRPTLIDPGEVRETTRTAKINKPVKASTSASTSANSILVIQTDPADAEISINGKPAGKSEGGEFRKELPGGRKYAIAVSAGDDYEPFTTEVMLKPRQPAVVPAVLNLKYGQIEIFPAIDGAKIFLDGKPVPADKVQFDKNERTYLLDRLAQGDHKITYDHPDYLPIERVFKISPGSKYRWNNVLERATDELIIETDPGTKVYSDSKPIGETAKDGKLRDTDISLGSHEIKLSKDGYEEYSEKSEFAYKKPVTLKKTLIPLPTSAEFSDDFDVNLSKWTVPLSGWKIESGRLSLANSPQVGLATGIRYRDFQMHFHLRLGNSDGAVWVLRAKDASDYYLFYLSGPSGKYPNRFLTYIVRDNKFELDQPAVSVPLIVKLQAGSDYDIDIVATKQLIEHTIRPANTGKAEKFGLFDDKDNTYWYGGIGFRTVASEKFSVDDLYVKPR